MTREEAIECLNFQNEKFFGGQSEALKMAISALSFLEREKKTVAERVKQNLSELAQYNADMLKAFNAGKELAEKEKGEWIPVAERLPEEGKNVLFCDIDNDIMLGYHLHYAPATHFVERGAWEDVKNVRAWMELPEPYKGGDV